MEPGFQRGLLGYDSARLKNRYWNRPSGTRSLDLSDRHMGRSSDSLELTRSEDLRTPGSHASSVGRLGFWHVLATRRAPGTQRLGTAPQSVRRRSRSQGPNASCRPASIKYLVKALTAQHLPKLPLSSLKLGLAIPSSPRRWPLRVRTA